MGILAIIVLISLFPAFFWACLRAYWDTDEGTNPDSWLWRLHDFLHPKKKERPRLKRFKRWDDSGWY